MFMSYRKQANMYDIIYEELDTMYMYMLLWSLASHPTYTYLCFVSTQNGVTPLFKAAQNGHPRVVEILIAAGAKVDLAKDVSSDSIKIHVTCNPILCHKSASASLQFTIQQSVFDIQ